MFAVSRKRSAGLAALFAVVMFALVGCSKLDGGDPIDVDSVDGSTTSQDGGTSADKPDTKADDGNVEVRIDGQDVKVNGAKPADLDVCSNIADKQASMPSGYMPGAGSTGNYKTGLFTCVKVSDMIGQHPGVNSDVLRRQIIAEVNRSFQQSGVNVTVK
jgi:hypothetical protein